MKVAVDGGFYELVVEFAKRLINLGTASQALAQRTTATMNAAQKQIGKSKQVKVNYDPRNQFVVCMKSLTPIYRGSPSVKCPFCKAAYKPEYKGIVCTVCNLCTVGGQASGLVILRKRHENIE
jgi:coatomer protein complex subunit alpha (xenin)